MVITDSMARLIAPASFIVDFGAQVYGLLSSPNMQDVHDANLSFWSPQPQFIGGFFLPQIMIQLVWLYRLFKLDGTKSGTNKKELQIVVNYVPYYALGNLSLAIWMLFWNASALKTAELFVAINAATQLLFVFTLQPPLNLRSTSSIITHLVSKSFLAIAVLDLLHNGSVAFFDHHTTAPSLLVKLVTGLVFGGLAAVSDWILGAGLVYDLVALAVGQRGYNEERGWSALLLAYAIGTAVIVVLRNLVRPPYVKRDLESDEYEAVIFCVLPLIFSMTHGYILGPFVACGILGAVFQLCCLTRFLQSV